VHADPDGLGDLELIARSLDEPALFAVLLTRHHRSIYRYLARRLPADAAEDCAQETFVRAFAARAGFRPYRASALPWLYGIATNLVRERAREEGRTLAGSRDDLIGWEDDAVERGSRPSMCGGTSATRSPRCRPFDRPHRPCSPLSRALAKKPRARTAQRHEAARTVSTAAVALSRPSAASARGPARRQRKREWMS